MLLLRYERTGDTRDLQESISNIRKSLDLIPPDHSDQSILLASLGVGLSAHSKRMNAPQYLNEAIEVNRQAVGMTPPLSIRFANRVMNLGADLLRRFEETGKVEDLKEAISNTQKAITCTPPDHPELSQMFNNLGTMKFLQHKQTGKIEGFGDAVDTVQKGADLTPDGHPSKIVKFNNLGTMFSWRYEKTGMTEHADKAIELYKLAFHCTTGSPLQRITAARQGIQLLVNSDRQKQANSLANKAVELFPQICSRYLDYEDQQHVVSQLAGLAADACALCLRTKGSPVRVLEILEHGRGLIVGYLIDGHGDIANLNISNPEKARGFDSLRSKASLSVSPDNPPEIRLQVLRERDKAAADLEDCIRDIRQLPNQDRFLLPPATKVLMSCASEGPIVIVNITSFSSDAIIITTTEIKAINLPNIQGAEIAQYRPWSLTADTRKATLVETSSGEDKISEPFSKLWSDCVRLVLEELGLMRPSKSQELPRIWWIGTGLASSLPFHAAGLHSAGSIENTASYMISSYIPTIKALLHAREKAAEHAIDAENSVLLVKMPHTPGERNLSGVEAEDKAIRCVFGDSVRVRSLDRPSKNEVLENLGNFSIVHFACHGSSDSRDPSRSFLALQGESKTIPDKLTVQEMANFNMGHAWLAYLSACSTAQNRVVGLSDEVLHLASAFQVAGFAHVVATMWESKDSICSQVAEVFYGHLTKTSDKGGHDGAVAEALHAAVEEIRKQSPEEPQLWAQFIHTGA
jgi:tetratricopeptide (TPR) repeat protein